LISFSERVTVRIASGVKGEVVLLREAEDSDPDDGSCLKTSGAARSDTLLSTMSRRSSVRAAAWCAGRKRATMR